MSYLCIGDLRHLCYGVGWLALDTTEFAMQKTGGIKLSKVLNLMMVMENEWLLLFFIFFMYNNLWWEILG